MKRNLLKSLSVLMLALILTVIICGCGNNTPAKTEPLDTSSITTVNGDITTSPIDVSTTQTPNSTTSTETSASATTSAITESLDTSSITTANGDVTTSPIDVSTAQTSNNTTSIETSVNTTVPAITTTSPETTESPKPIATSAKLMTFNLRYDTTSHPCMTLDVRGNHLMELIKKYSPDSISFNEATNDWMNFLRNEMGKLNYSYVGLGRDRGMDGPTLTGTGNEHCPVFYRSDIYELIDSGNFWLSTTPDVKGSTSWNSACTRICSFVVLKNKETGFTYAHLSTHLDHVSEEAQFNAVNVIQVKINEILEKYGDIGLVLSGDFNSVKFDSTDADYNPVVYNTVTAFLDDSLTLAENVVSNGSTFSGYQNPDDWEKGQASTSDKPQVDTASSPIDYIFLRKGAYSVSTYKIVDDLFTFDYDGKTWTNHPVSDHYGVYCEATFNTGNELLVRDESKTVVYPAEIKTESSVIASFGETENVSSRITITSGLDTNTDYPITNLLNTTAITKIATKTSQTGKSYWEITLKLDTLYAIKAASYTTTENSEALPSGVIFMVLNLQNEWEKIGSTDFSDKSISSTTYIVPSETVSGKTFKFIFTGAPTGCELANISLFGEETDNGVIDRSEITLISGPKAGEKEGYEKLFDGDTSTKFYIRMYQANAVPTSDFTPVTGIVFKTAAPTTIKTYNLTTANDNEQYPGRTPREWILYGSQTGEDDSWTVLDAVDNPKMADKNLTTYTYEVDNVTSCQYYKLVITVIGTGGNVQFSEAEFFE